MKCFSFSCAFAGLIAAATAAAQAPAPLSVPDRMSYAAKFVCGVSPVLTTSPPREPVVKRGNYATAVNIHNPWATPVTLNKRISLSVPERYPNTEFKNSTRRVAENLPAGSSMYVDCDEIVRLLQGNAPPIAIPGTFIEGFVVVDAFTPATPLIPSAPAEIDVVTVTTTSAIQSAAGAVGADVNDHEVTVVPGKKLPKGQWPF